MESIKITPLSPPAPAHTQTFTWEVEVTWEERKIINQNDIVQVALGKKPSEAVLLLQEKFDLENTPIIELLPSWWLRIPSLPFRIILNEGEG